MSFIKNSSIFFISNILATGITIGSLPVLTRYLTPQDYGVLALFLTFGQVSAGITSLGLSTATYKYFFDYKNNRKTFKIINTTNIFTNLFIFIIIGFLINYFSPLISEKIFDKKINPGLINLSFLCGCLNYFNFYFYQLFIAQKKATLFGILTVGQSLIRLISVLLLIYFYSFKYMALIYGLLISNIIILLFLLITNKNLITKKYSINYFVQSVKLSYPQIPTLILGLLYASFDRIMLNKIGGVGAVGNYSFGAKFGNLIKFVNDSFGNVFGPFFQEQGKNADFKNSKNIIDRFLFIASLILFVSIAMILFAEEIVKLFTTPAFYPSMFVIPIYIFYHLFGVLGILATNQLLKAEKLISEIPTSIISLSINISLNFFLIPIYGIIGAAIATAIAALINNSILLYFGFKAFPIKNFKLKYLISIYLIAIIFSVLSYSLMIIDLDWLNKVLIKLAIIISIIFSLCKLNYINKSKINNLFQIIKSY